MSAASISERDVLLIFPDRLNQLDLMKGGRAGAPHLVLIEGRDKNGRKTRQWVRRDKAQQLALFDGIGEPYGPSIETRPGTTEKQRKLGRDALQDLKRAVERLRIPGEHRAAILGASIYRDFVATGGAALVGKSAGTPAELALIAQVYRDPRFETLRFVYTKDGTVVGENAVSSRLPGVVWPSANFMDVMKSDMAALGADGYHVIHNHPSGSSMPSRADEVLTKQIAATVPGFVSHVVIDHNEYSVISQFGASKTVSAPELGGQKFQDMPAVEHPLLQARAGSPGDVAAVAKALQSLGEATEKTAVLVMNVGGSESRIGFICQIPMTVVESAASGRKYRDKLRMWIRSMSRRAGTGGHSFLIAPGGNSSPYTRAGMKELVEKSIVTDAIDPRAGVSLRSSVLPLGEDPRSARKEARMAPLRQGA